ncbi:hypothetical protein N7532_003098 [Penicillium argentinense]|uniref:Uncharacterized protein n=1 Tax=Penicillium argentinense TaxID=1131581 RepID=A0A9W9KDP0_9EURO|nr:uncharacterized protein N7532_003098 [Penicillium argentinense]KAJ5102569.1 hypothetical protein N7532_003098 [Penicillium argentinense]
MVSNLISARDEEEHHHLHHEFPVDKHRGCWISASLVSSWNFVEPHLELVDYVSQALDGDGLGISPPSASILTTVR